jgi:hypothetical protein
MSHDLATALAMLNPETATDWNKGGQPSVERLQELTGNKSLTRAMIVEAAPDLDRERAPKIAAATPAAVPATSGDMPDWAKALMAKSEEQDAAIALLTERNENLTVALEEAELRATSGQTADDVVDGDLPPELRHLDPNDPNSGLRPPAAPTPLAMGAAAGDSAGIFSIHPARSFKGRMSRRWPGSKGEPLKDVPVVAIAVGQYPAQPGKLRYIGETFNFSGVPGSWFVPAAHPDVPKFLSGELTTVDAARLWGLRQEMSGDE